MRKFIRYLISPPPPPLLPFMFLVVTEEIHSVPYITPPPPPSCHLRDHMGFRVWAVSVIPRTGHAASALRPKSRSPNPQHPTFFPKPLKVLRLYGSLPRQGCLIEVLVIRESYSLGSIFSWSPIFVNPHMVYKKTEKAPQKAKGNS